MEVATSTVVPVLDAHTNGDKYNTVPSGDIYRNIPVPCS